MSRFPLLVLCALCACDRLEPGGGGDLPDGGDAADVGADTGSDAGADTGTATDSGTDTGTATDAGVDAGADAGADTGTATDAGADAGTDAATDAGGAWTAHGRVTFEDRLDGVNGPGSFVTAPVSGVAVELVDGAGDTLAWDYADEDGNWTLTVESPTAPAAKLRIVFGDGREEGVFGVTDENYDTWQIVDPRAVPWNGAALDVHFAKTSDGGAVSNIFTVVRRSLALIYALAGTAGPTFSAVWRHGWADDCWTCYWESAIYISGLDEDRDDYDDAVIGHEVGHFFAEQFTVDDSGGGAHDGSRDDPQLAWSEGFATFFGQAVLEHPYYVDTDATDFTMDDIEDMTAEDSYGTHNGSMTGRVSELLVAAALWDFRDTNAETYDTLSVSDDVVFDSPLRWFTHPSFSDRGSAGTDFVDYLDGWFCRAHAKRTQVEAIVVNDREFPYDFATRPACPKPRAPVVFVDGRLRTLAELSRVTVRVVEVRPDGAREPLTPARTLARLPAFTTVRPAALLGAAPSRGGARYLSVETISPGGLRRHRSFKLD